MKQKANYTSSQSHQSLVAAITPTSARSIRTGSKNSIFDATSFRDGEVPDNGSLRRVDVYTGPPPMPFLSSPPPELPPKLNSTPPASAIDEFSPPELPPKSWRTPQANSYPMLNQPQDVSYDSNFQIRSPSAANLSAENFHSESQFDFVQQGNTLLSQRPPALPPKPKQYKIRPLSDEQQKVIKPKEKRKSAQTESSRKQTKKHQKTTRLSHEQAGKPAKSSKRKSENEVDRKREHRRRSDSRNQAKVKRRSTLIKDSEENARKLEQLHRQEALLRQILQGITEAEMLKAKLQRTQNWTKEQEALEISQPKPEYKRSEKPGKYEGKRRTKSSRYEQEDLPPSYARSITPS